MAKYIIVGLGNFGKALAIKLTEMGHEIIGVDHSEDRVELLKDQITHTIAMDATQESALKMLPLHDSDAVIVAIGESFGPSIQITALLKNLGVPRIIGRVQSEVHHKVLEAIGIKELVKPEEDSADVLAHALDLKGVRRSIQLPDHYFIVEADIPTRYIGKKVSEVNFRGRYNLNIVTIKKCNVCAGKLGREVKESIMGVVSPDYVFESGDVVLFFGREADLEKILS